MKNKTLLILAAGMGSRFGGLKQATAFGPSGEYIIDYSIFDAIRCGFNKVVFIIKEENYDLFRNTVGKRIENHIKVEYVFQKLDNIPSKYKIPENRVKPMGTAHAILCAKNVINEPFVMINADDYYGFESFKIASDFIDNNEGKMAILGYKVTNTMSENGSVKRGVIRSNKNDLSELIESSIIQENNVIKATKLSDGEEYTIGSNTLVSMNMIVLNPDFFEYIESNLSNFMENSNLEKDEYLIPDVITKSISENKYNFKVLKTPAKWVGVTYKEDKDMVTNYINELIKDGLYNKNLWN